MSDATDESRAQAEVALDTPLPHVERLLARRVDSGVAQEEMALFMAASADGLG